MAAGAPTWTIPPPGTSAGSWLPAPRASSAAGSRRASRTPGARVTGFRPGPAERSADERRVSPGPTSGMRKHSATPLRKQRWSSTWRRRRTGTGASMDEPRADFEDNVMGAVFAAGGGGGSGRPRARVVLASTRQLYGRGRLLPADEGHVVAPAGRPRGPQGKRPNTWCATARRSGASPFAVLRLTNTLRSGAADDGPGGPG